MFKHQFFRPLFLFIVLLLILGCGNGEEDMKDTMKDVTPAKAPPNYYPMTVGSRWVYRNPDGSEWAREVTEATEVGLYLYHFFSYDPPIEDATFGFLKTPAYATTRNRVFLLVESEIDDAARQEIISRSQMA